MSPHETAQELLSLKEQMEDLLGQAEQLLRNVEDRSIFVRAESYWIPHIKSALGGHGYSAMCSMEDTCNELEESGNEEE
jgi:hypothetical protein